MSFGTNALARRQMEYAVELELAEDRQHRRIVGEVRVGKLDGRELIGSENVEQVHFPPVAAPDQTMHRMAFLHEEACEVRTCEAADPRNQKIQFLTPD